MFRTLSYVGASAVLVFIASEISAQQLQYRPPEQNPRVVICKVMETHASREPAVSVLVFHQRDRADAERLKELLQKSVDGGTVEFRAGENSQWRPAAVARLKSCFGRGLLILPAGPEPLAAGETFLLRFPVVTLTRD